jgi:hypothetical protein
MAFLENLAAGLSGFGAGVNDPSFGIKLLEKRREAEAEAARQSKLAQLAATNDPNAMLQFGATQDPAALAKYAEYLNAQRKPVAPLTSGLPEGYMWQGNKAVPIAVITPKADERKIMEDREGRHRYVDTGEEVFPMARPKPPSGFQYADDGALIPIVGSDEYKKQEQEKASQAAFLNAAGDKAALVNEKVDEALKFFEGNIVDPSETYGKLTSYVPGSDAYQFDQVAETLKSALSLDKLAEMKAMSPTGASGFGALSEKELSLLTSALTSLDVGQSTETLKKNLGKVGTHYNKWYDAVRQANGLEPLYSDGKKNANKKSNEELLKALGL